MTSLLEQLGVPTAVGVSLGESEMAICHVASGPFGLIELSRKRVPFEADQLQSTLGRELARFSNKVQVSIGLPEHRLFFSSRPTTSGGEGVSGNVLLREALQQSNLPVDQMAVDVVHSQPRRRPIVSIAACDHDYLDSILTVVNTRGIASFRVEPTACGQIRAASRDQKKHRRGEVVLRLFLGSEDGLAVAVVDNLPVLWRRFTLTRGDEAATIIAACRAVYSLGPACGIDPAFESVVIHGRDEIQPLIEVDWLRKQIGVPSTWLSGPPLDPGEAAFGLARGCLVFEEHFFDFSRASKRLVEKSIEIPVRTLIYQSIVLACVALFLFTTYVNEERKLAEMRTRVAMMGVVSTVSDAELEKERSDLKDRLASLQRFLQSRVVWTAHTRSITDKLGEGVHLTFMQGAAALPLGSTNRNRRKTPARQLMLQGSAPVRYDGRTPPEINTFVTALQRDEPLAKVFPELTLSELRIEETNRGNSPSARFTVELKKAGKK